MVFLLTVAAGVQAVVAIAPLVRWLEVSAVEVLAVGRAFPVRLELLILVAGVAAVVRLEMEETVALEL